MNVHGEKSKQIPVNQKEATLVYPPGIRDLPGDDRTTGRRRPVELQSERGAGHVKMKERKPESSGSDPLPHMEHGTLNPFGL